MTLLPLTLLRRSDIQAREMQNTLKDCLDGRMLARAEALALADAEGDEFESLLATAAELRDRCKGKGRYIFAEDFCPAHEPLPRLLRLLYFPQGAG